MTALHVTLFGGFDARLPSGSTVTLPTKKAQALLAYLAMRPGQAHPRARLATLLWGDTGDEQARSSLRQTLLVLRRAVSSVKPPALVVDTRTVALNAAAAQVDVADFEQALAKGGPEAMERAVALYKGDLLDGFDLKESAFEQWLSRERDRLRAAALDALGKLLAQKQKAGRAESAIETATRLLALDPTQEAAHRALMRLHARQGRRAAALRQYQHCVTVLRRELDVEPEAETKALYQEILKERGGEALVKPRPERAPARASTAVVVDFPVSDTPLIGRERELTELRRALEASSHGHGHTVAVVGEAGIGKSRLVQEIADHGRRHHCRVLWGRSYESERILAFGPWVDAFRNGLPTSSMEVLGEFNAVWRAELTQLFPELGPPGRSGSDPGNYLVLFEAIAQLTAYLASRQPLVIILEDIHWADEVTLRLLSFLGRRLPSLAVLLVVTARQEEVSDQPGLRHALDELTRERRLLQVVLSSLSHTEALALVRTLAGAGRAPAGGLGEEVWSASEGNPFMIFETVRALQEGARPESKGRLPLPERVRTVIAGRLERLSGLGQEVLATAAVIGREFDFALLHRASGLSVAQASEAVEELIRRRVLSGAEERFDFTHDRIREVAYARLLPPRRKLLHRLVAEALEGLPGYDPAARHTALAVHYFEGELWDKALRYLKQAGDTAAARGAHREAAMCFDRALLALSHTPEGAERTGQEFDLRFSLRNALLPLGDHARIVEQLERAKQLAEGLDDQRRLGWIQSYLARELWLSGDSRQAIDAAERALAIAESLGDSGIQVLANVRLGQAYHALGQYTPAIECLTRTIAALEGKAVTEYTGTAAPPSVIARIWLTWSLAERGDFADGLARAEEGLRIAEATRQPYPLVAACFALGLLHLRRGDFQRAIAVLERGLLQAQDRDVPVFFSWIASTAGFAHARAGDLATGLRLMEQAVEPTRWTATVPQAFPLLLLGEGYLLAGRASEALDTTERALTMARERSERGHEAWALRLLGEIHARRGNVGDAEASYRQARELASELEMRPLLAHCHLGLAALLRPAAGELAAASDLFREMAMTFWLGQAETVARSIA